MYSVPTIEKYDSDILLKSLQTTDTKISFFENRWCRARMFSGVLLITAGVIAVAFYVATWGSAVEDNNVVTDGNLNSINEALATISIIFAFLPCIACVLVPLCTKHEILHRQTTLKSFSSIKTEGNDGTNIEHVEVTSTIDSSGVA